MSDLAGYIGPNVASGSFIWNQASFALADLNASIALLVEKLVAVGWTQPMVAGVPAGTFASGTAIATFPFHPPTGPALTYGSAICTMNGNDYQFYDPFAGDPDPTTPGVIGVPLAGTPLGTVDNFIGFANANTPFSWSVVSSTDSESTLSVVATTTGPDYNITGFQSFSWSSFVPVYLGFSPEPTGGGSTVFSAPAPVTGDQMSLTFYYGSFDSHIAVGPGILVEMPAAAPATGFAPAGPLPQTANSPSANQIVYQPSQSALNFGVGPYQALLSYVPGTSGTPFGITSLLAAALNVPSEMGPASIDISGVSNSAAVPVVITTSSAHGLSMQDRVLLQAIGGATNANGAWWVAKIPSDTMLWLSNAPLVFLFGDGNTYTGGGSVYDVATSTSYSISAVRNDTGDPVLITTSTAHGLEPGDFADVSGVGGIAHLTGSYSVAAVPSPTTFEIATLDAGILEGSGAAYTSGGALTTGIFQSMIASSALADLFYDDGEGTMTASQGISGAFADQRRTHIDGSKSTSTLAAYTVALHVPWTGVAGDQMTSAAKPIIVAPYVATRIAPAHETRIAGTLWDSYVHLQNFDYGTPRFVGGVGFSSVLNIDTLTNATLFLRAQNT
jgi:hypothetical protein